MSIVLVCLLVCLLVVERICLILTWVNETQRVVIMKTASAGSNTYIPQAESQGDRNNDLE